MLSSMLTCTLALQEHENRRRKNLQWKLVEKQIENFLLHWKARIGLDTKMVSGQCITSPDTRLVSYYYYRVLRAICCQPVDGSLICFM